MINAKPFMDKTNEIKRRMDYIIENWESDSRITPQEIRFVCVLYLHGLYDNEKVSDLAKTYFQKAEEKKRLDSETLLTAIAAALIIDRDFTNYWEKLRDLTNRSHGTEKENLIMHLLIILTPKLLKKFEDDDKTYIKTLLEELDKQNTEKKLFSFWTEKRLFSSDKKISVSTDQIQHLKEYLLWEIINLGEYDDFKKELREKFIPEMLEYEVDRIDWIVFLIYQFLKKNRIHIITEMELNEKISHQIRSAIGKKVWFPLVLSIMFMFVKLWLSNIITIENLSNIKTIETLGQTIILVLGALFLYFEERLPSFEMPVKRYRVTFGQIGEFLMIVSILWALNRISLIKGALP